MEAKLKHNSYEDHYIIFRKMSTATLHAFCSRQLAYLIINFSRKCAEFLELLKCFVTFSLYYKFSNNPPKH